MYRKQVDVFHCISISKVGDFCKKNNIPLHCDGARLFNAAVQLGVSAFSLVEPCDSVSVCLSKGLGAPVGSVVVGSKSFIARYTFHNYGGKYSAVKQNCNEHNLILALIFGSFLRCKRMRKLLGGGMRQSGVLAAAGLYALSHNLPKLKSDNDIAHHLAKGKCPPISKTNIVVKLLKYYMF